MSKPITTKQIMFIDDLSKELDFRIEGDQSNIKDLLWPVLNHYSDILSKKRIYQLSSVEAGVIIEMLKFLKYSSEREQIVNKKELS